jgi:hypothetical protein
MNGVEASCRALALSNVSMYLCLRSEQFLLGSLIVSMCCFPSAGGNSQDVKDAYLELEFIIRRQQTCLNGYKSFSHPPRSSTVCREDASSGRRDEAQASSYV